MIQITGKLKFDPINYTKKHVTQGSWKHTAIVEFADDSDLYYSWFIKRRYNLILNRPLRGFHFTVINDKITNLSQDEIIELKKLFQDTEIKVQFDTDLRTNGEHWWLKAYSIDCENIRKAFNLDPRPFWSPHLTVGYVVNGQPNKNGIRYNQMWEHSHYLHKLLIEGKII